MVTVDNALFVLHLTSGLRISLQWPGTVSTLFFTQLKTLIYVLLVQWSSMAIKSVMPSVTAAKRAWKVKCNGLDSRASP